MSGPDIAGLAVSVVLVTTRVGVLVAEFRNRMNQRLTWLESQINMWDNWERTLEYISTKIEGNEHLIDRDGLVLIKSQLDTVQNVLESVDCDLKTLTKMSNRYPWNQIHAQWKLDGKRPDLDGAITTINASFNIVNAILGLAMNLAFRNCQPSPQKEQQFPESSSPPSPALSSPRPSVASTMSAMSTISTVSTIDDSARSHIKVACKGLDFRTVKRLLDQDDTGNLHLTTDSKNRTLLDIAIKHNSSVNHGLVETMQILIEKEVKFTLDRSEHRDTLKNVKAEIRSRKKRRR